MDEIYTFIGQSITAAIFAALAALAIVGLLDLAATVYMAIKPYRWILVEAVACAAYLLIFVRMRKDTP